MNGALTGLLLIVLWGTVLLRLPTLWRDTQQRAVWATLLTLALLKTIATPGVNGLLAGFVSQPQVIPHVLAVLAAFFMLRFISLITAYYSARPGAARHQFLLAVSVLAVLLALIVVAPDEIKTKGTELMSTPIAPSVAAYWVVLNGYLGSVAVIATRLFWRVRRSAPPGLLRQGLLAIAVGICLVALYAILKTVLIVLHAFGVTLTVDTIEPVANAVRAVGAILSVVGAAVPATGKVRSVVRAYRSFVALAPLWRVMRRTFPGMILFSRRRSLVELAGVEDVQLRLYRRVIEIRDGLLALRPYLPGDAFDRARALLGERATPALVEACGIAVALDRHRAATPAGHELPETDGPARDKAKEHGSDSADRLIRAQGPHAARGKSAADEPATADPTASKQLTKAGDRHTRVGEQHADAGEQHSHVGEQHADAGRQRIQAGRQRTRAGEQHTHVGSQHIHAGSQHTDAGGQWTDAGSQLTDEIAWLSSVSAAYRTEEPKAFAHLHTSGQLVGSTRPGRL